MSHSKLPWYVECFDGDDVINIRARPERGLTTHVVYMDFNDEEARDNAAFIVKACNNHYKLLEALKELVEAEWMVTHDWGGDRKSVMKKAEQAIKEAEQ